MKSILKIGYSSFGWKHIVIIFAVLTIFQVFVSNLQQKTLKTLLDDTMDWSKQHSAEQIANLTAAGLEILLETKPSYNKNEKGIWETNHIHGLNSILKQPIMNRTVEELTVILPFEEKYVALDVGKGIYDYFYNNIIADTSTNIAYSKVLVMYDNIHNDLSSSELTTSIKDESEEFNVFVPLVPNGEYRGALYLKVKPDLSFISNQVLSSFNQTVVIFSGLIIMGFLGMFYISSYTILERDQTREELYKEREAHLADKIAKEKEYHFTKRIYHTHHKAEKVMGFINEDIESVKESNLNEVKYRIEKYANFISRVIYDMKWFNPPLQTIRGPFFNTNLNEVLKFIVNNIFLRISYPVGNIKFEFDLDESVPIVHVNEFVAWEVIEPLIQNAIEHSNTESVEVTIITEYNKDQGTIYLSVIDNGKGISEELIETDENGIQKIFIENVSTKDSLDNHGYGCYLAYVIAQRCGWSIVAMNEKQGAKFVLEIKTN